MLGVLVLDLVCVCSPDELELLEPDVEPERFEAPIIPIMTAPTKTVPRI